MRMIPSLAAASTAAFLVFGGAAFAMATAGGGNGHPNAPSGPTGGNPGGRAAAPVTLAGCDYLADQSALDEPARRTFLWRCQQGDGF
jgi:hypothetical protein